MKTFLHVLVAFFVLGVASAHAGLLDKACTTVNVVQTWGTAGPYPVLGAPPAGAGYYQCVDPVPAQNAFWDRLTLKCNSPFVPALDRNSCIPAPVCTTGLINGILPSTLSPALVCMSGCEAVAATISDQFKTNAVVGLIPAGTQIWSGTWSKTGKSCVANTDLFAPQPSPNTDSAAVPPAGGVCSATEILITNHFGYICQPFPGPDTLPAATAKAAAGTAAATAAGNAALAAGATPKIASVGATTAIITINNGGTPADAAKAAAAAVAALMQGATPASGVPGTVPVSAVLNLPPDLAKTQDIAAAATSINAHVDALHADLDTSAIANAPVGTMPSTTSVNAAVTAENDKSVAMLASASTNGFANDRALSWWQWQPSFGTSTCSPFSKVILGKTITFDLCVWVANIRDAIGWLFSIYAIWNIYGLVFRRTA